MTETWIPEFNALVRHVPTNLLFVVQRRSKRTDPTGKVIDILLWDAPNGRVGRSFPVDECKEVEQIEFWNEVEQFSTGGEITIVCASIGKGNDIYLSVSKGDRMKSILIPSMASRVYKAAVDLAAAFNGEVIEEEQVANSLTTQCRKEA